MPDAPQCANSTHGDGARRSSAASPRSTIRVASSPPEETLGDPDDPRASRVPDPGRPSAGLAIAAVRLEGVTKRYGDVEAVAGIDLDIGDGEFFSMLGPSGSGKTTTLRMIAGFELPTDGRVLLHGAGRHPSGRRSSAT